MTPFRHLLHDHRLWGIRRKTVVPAFAIGLFVMWMPIPGHMILASIIALFMRVNVPVAFVTTLISNPVTMPAMYLLAYTIGAWLLGMPVVPQEFDISIEWVMNTLIGFWQPMMLGSVLLGTFSSLIGLVVLDLVWRSSIADYKARKRKEREQ